MSQGAAGPGGREARARVLKELAVAEGFSLVGICEPAPSHHMSHLREWVAQGRHGEMGYLAREDALFRRSAPEASFPAVRSVLVVGHEYFQEDGGGVPEDPSLGVIARYARGRDYHKVVRKGLTRVLRRFQGEVDAGTEGQIHVDTGPVLERELGVRSGLGWFGRNTMLIHPRKGSYFFLGVLFLNVELEADPPFQRDHCGSCKACLDACPTGALLGRDGAGAPVMDARRCISYFTIENRGPIPMELRPLMGNRVYGCDICQEVCPFNVRFAKPAAEPGYAARGPGEVPVGVEVEPASAGSPEGGARGPGNPAPAHPGTDAPSLVALLGMALNPEAWEAFSRGSAIRRAGRAGFARNVCVGLGNWLAAPNPVEPWVGAPEGVPEEALEVLTAALSDPEPLVRGHAAWALGRLGSERARQRLSAAAARETDAWVASEVAAARAGLRPLG